MRIPHPDDHQLSTLNVVHQLICICWSDNMLGFAIVVGLVMIAAWARMLIFPDRINIIAIII